MVLSLINGQCQPHSHPLTYAKAQEMRLIFPDRFAVGCIWLGMRLGVRWPLSDFLVVPSQQSWYWTTQWNSTTSCNHVLDQLTNLFVALCPDPTLTSAPCFQSFNDIHENCGIRLHQVKTYCTDLSVTSLCMAVNGIHDPQICPNIKLKAVNWGS